MPTKWWFLPAAAISVLAVSCQSDPVAAGKRYAASGDHYAGQGKFKEAIVEYKNAVQSNGKDGEIRLKLGDLLAKTGDFSSAIASYVRAADLLPDSLDAQLKAAGLLIASGSFEDGKARADKALVINPKSVQALVLRGNALAGLKQYDDAMDQIENYLKGLLQQQRLTSFSCDAGVAFVKRKRSATIADTQTFREHVISTGNFDLCDFRAKPEAVEDYAKEHDGQVPPCVNFRTYDAVQVNRK